MDQQRASFGGLSGLHISDDGTVVAPSLIAVALVDATLDARRRDNHGHRERDPNATANPSGDNRQVGR